MRGYIDCSASDIQPSDTILDPMTGVLVRVESVEPVSAAGIVAIHGKGCVSLSYMGLSVKPDRPIRRAPRPGEFDARSLAGVSDVDGTWIQNPHTFTKPSSYVSPRKVCACGYQSPEACAQSCLKG